MESKYPIIRNLDGCYARVERDGKYYSLCLSDLTEKEQKDALGHMGCPENWIGYIQGLLILVRYFGDKFDVVVEE